MSEDNTAAASRETRLLCGCENVHSLGVKAAAAELPAGAALLRIDWEIFLGRYRGYHPDSPDRPDMPYREIVRHALEDWPHDGVPHVSYRNDPVIVQHDSRFHSVWTWRIREDGWHTMAGPDDVRDHVRAVQEHVAPLVTHLRSRGGRGAHSMPRFSLQEGIAYPDWVMDTLTSLVHEDKITTWDVPDTAELFKTG